jgi:hypothetical protein
MERIDIHTGLDHFVMVDAIDDMDENQIDGEVTLENADPTLLLESLAQLAGLHIRHSLDFAKHAFLVRISGAPLPEEKSLTGTYRLRGNLISRSEEAFTYRLEACRENVPVIHGQFLFGTVDYNDDFQKDILQKHYREVLACAEKK